MSRPKKTDSKELVKIVDLYFTTEAAGNPDMLKCSFLEAFALKNGVNAKAYDFRRDKDVRIRIDELKLLAKNENGVGILHGNTYKNLDINQILRARRDPDELRMILGEMDKYWKRIYENSVLLLDKNKEVNRTIDGLKKDKRNYEMEINELHKSLSEKISVENKLIVENRYLRKMLKTYLYPAVANEILQREKLIDNPDTQITKAASEDMIEKDFPESFSESVTNDKDIISKEEEILRRMRESIDAE
jgi:hypothetical protein